MPPSRGRGRGRGAATGRRGRSASVADSDAPLNVPGTQLCGTCCKDVDKDAIGCDDCETWVHSTEMCSGLTTDMIKAIERYDGAGIRFVCTKCRLDFSTRRVGSPTSSTEMHLVELVKHLSQQLMGICSVVQQLKTEISQMRASPEPIQSSLVIPQLPPSSSVTPGANQTVPPPGTTPALGASSTSEYRKVVREELRELQEQQKRRTSLVIRGLKARTADAAVLAFQQVSEFLTNQKVSLTDVVRISSETDLYRGKVADDDIRKLILDRAKQLKDSDHFGSVFIRRDLTYKQRSELRAKRASAEVNTNPTNPGTQLHGPPTRHHPAHPPTGHHPRNGDGHQVAPVPRPSSLAPKETDVKQLAESNE